jgi:hypothetical protein
MSSVESRFEQSKKLSIITSSKSTRYSSFRCLCYFIILEKVAAKEKLQRKKMEVKLKTARDKLENLTITIKNDGSATKKKKNSNEKVDKEQNQNPLLERLRSKFTKFLSL